MTPLEKHIEELLDDAGPAGIATAVVISGGIFSGSLRRSESEGLYDFAAVMPTNQGVQTVPFKLSPSAIFGISDPIPVDDSPLVTPGRH